MRRPYQPGFFRIPTLSRKLLHAVQARSNTLQFLSHGETAKHPTAPRCGLGPARVYNATLFCKKKGHKARRREGDKCFLRKFFRVVAEFGLPPVMAMRPPDSLRIPVSLVKPCGN